MINSAQDFRKDIDDVFGARLLSFLGALESSTVPIGDFDRAIRDLPVGDPYAKAGRFELSASNLFRKLSLADQGYVREYWRVKVKNLQNDARFGEIVHKFPAALSGLSTTATGY